jgi:hypothetical protein
MDFIVKNWTLIFGGIGPAIIAAIVGAWAKSIFERKRTSTSASSNISQKAETADSSQIAQAGRDARVVINPSAPDRSLDANDERHN